MKLHTYCFHEAIVKVVNYSTFKTGHPLRAQTGKLKTIFVFNCDKLFSTTQLRAGAKLASICQITGQTSESTTGYRHLHGILNLL